MNTSDILGITGILVGALLSYYFYRLSIRAKEPYWMIRSNNLVQDLSTELSGVEIMYRGKSVENLTISKLLFWNAGLDTIHKTDLDTSFPLRVSISGGKFLDAQIILTNNDPSEFGFRLDDSGEYVQLDFNYLDQQHGALLQIIHTGITSNQITVAGAIKGVKSIVQFESLYPRRPSKLFSLLPKKLSFVAPIISSSVNLFGAFFFFGLAMPLKINSVSSWTLGSLSLLSLYIFIKESYSGIRSLRTFPSEFVKYFQT